MIKEYDRKNGCWVVTLVNESGQRLKRRLVVEKSQTVYVALGMNPADTYGFDKVDGKPRPSNPHKHLRLLIEK